MEPAEVCDSQEQARSTSERREVDLITTRQYAHQRRSRNGFNVTDVGYNIYSSTNRLSEHRMVPAEVCDGQEQARSTLDGREVDLTTRRCVCQRRSSNGSTVTYVRYNIRSSTNGLPEHRIVAQKCFETC